jgi:hypothetical protein
MHDEHREKDVVAVTKDLMKRYPSGEDPLDYQPRWSREIGIKATAGVEAALEAGVEQAIGEDQKTESRCHGWHKRAG